MGSCHLPTSTRVASESGGIFSKIPDDECPVSPFPCWEARGKESTRLPPSLPLSFLTMFRLGLSSSPTHPWHHLFTEELCLQRRLLGEQRLCGGP